jgi:HAD superfamily phosphatase (TIGR01668 family)
MLKSFYPDEFCESTYAIDYAALYRGGVRGLIFDIDNTLVPHGAPADERSRELFRKLRAMGFRTCLLSNNRRPRVESFARDVGAEDYVWKSGKPKPSACRKAMAAMGTSPETTVFIGDQLFTDICCANWAHVRSILVRQIDKKEEIQIVFKRRLEKIVLYFWRRQRRRENGAENG